MIRTAFRALSDCALFIGMAISLVIAGYALLASGCVNLPPQPAPAPLVKPVPTPIPVPYPVPVPQPPCPICPKKGEEPGGDPIQGRTTS
jgi:hypothetical protein